MNLVVLKGRATSDIELKYTTNNTPVASFTLAVDRNYTPQGQERQTDFIPCVAWRNTAEFISKWFSKGSLMLVKGELQVRKYEDSNGNKRQAYEIIIDTAEFCESKKDNNLPTANTKPPVSADFEEVNDDFGDLPF